MKSSCYTINITNKQEVVMTTKKMNTSKAVMIIEGDIEPDYPEQYIDAWQFLINNGQVWKLQGWYGRTARTLITEGICTVPMEKGEEQ